MGGGTHARVMPNSVGFGMALPNTKNIFGEGRGLYHQPDEALHIPSLLEAIKIYILSIYGIDI
jgi:succinyl-diaminopimelate desuccinylase